MCIIVAKERGLELPSKETLETCFLNNPDGAGFMYVKNGKVIIDKGYMNFKSFYKRLEKLDRKLHLKDKALVMHFRIGTHGENDKQTTHPFPITNNAEYLRKTYFTTDIGMAHNGIIPHYDYDRVLSDTQLFIKDVVSVLKELNKKFYKNKDTLDMLERVCNSKLCFLDTKENITYIGRFLNDKDGIKYSNDTFSYCKYYTPTPSKTTKALADDNYDDKWDEAYDYFDYKRKSVEDFKDDGYIKLDKGNVLELNDGTIWEVEEDDTYYMTDYGDIYIYYDGAMSLIETDTVYLSDYNNHALRGCEA